MADKHIWEIESASTMRDEDRLFIVVGTSEFLISKSDFKKALGGLSSVDTTKLSKIIIDGDGSRVLANNGEYISLGDLYENKHNHNNKTILDKFTIDSETGKLLYDGNEVTPEYEEYKLPVATSNTLGGVKVDGSTITVDGDGVISGASTYELPTASDTVLGGVKIDNDTIKINDGTISADVIGNWSSGVKYPVGYFVVYEEALYECITANNDTVWTKDNWLLIGGKNTGMTINNWTTNTEYTVGNLIINGTIIYQCHTAHTSGETFDTTNWTAMTGEKGEKGTDGISPTANVEQTESGAIITITDATETTTAELANGITPHIDETSKNWMIGDKDTGVLAEGTVEINADCAVLYATFTADGWSDTAPYTQTVVVNNIAADNTPIVDISYSADTSLWDSERKAYNCLTKMETIDGGIVAYCLDSKPESDFTVKLRIAGDMSGLTFVTKDEFDKLINTNYTGTLLAADWVGDTAPYTQTLNIEGITENLYPNVDIVVSDDVSVGTTEINEWWKITKITTGENIVTAMCYEQKPTVDINIKIKAV